MGRVIPAFAQFFDGEGQPLINGWLQFLVSTTNNTPKNTYADPVYQILNANPLQLDAEGRCPNVFGVGDFRIISFVNDPEDEDSPGEMIQMFDPVTAQGTVEASGGSGNVFDAWVNTVTYDLGDIVERDLGYYRSLINSNLGQDPLLIESAWEQIDFIAFYNSTIFYNIGELVYYEDNLWLSLTDSNQNNTPSTSPSDWRRVATGYKGFVENVGSYVITTVDRDNIVVLTSSAVADATFTLPAMGATTDRFKLAIYNASSYLLTIDAAGSPAIWLNSSGSIDITEGCLVELMYYYSIDTWLPVGGNTGPVLGGQDIGTALIPVDSLFATAITATTLNVPTITATQIDTSFLNFPDDGFIYFGDSDEVQMTYASATTSFDIEVSAGVNTNYIIDGVTMWTFDASGELYPGASNPIPDLGTASNSVDFIYANNVSLPDNGQLLLGDSDDLSLIHNGTDSRVLSTSALYVGTTTATDLWLISNGVAVIRIDALSSTFTLNRNVVINVAFPSIVLGSIPRIQIQYNGSCYFDVFSGAMDFRYNGTNILGYTSAFDLHVYQDTHLITDKIFYFGTLNQTGIYYNSTFSVLAIATFGTSSTWINTNNQLRWVFGSTGHFTPGSSEAYDVGSSGALVRALYTAAIYGDGTPINVGLSSGAPMSIDDIYVCGARVCINVTFAGNPYTFTSA